MSSLEDDSRWEEKCHNNDWRSAESREVIFWMEKLAKILESEMEKPMTHDVVFSE